VNASTEQLLTLIGGKEVELHLLRQQLLTQARAIAEALWENGNLKAELAALRPPPESGGTE
jgi:hypothetical protein